MATGVDIERGLEKFLTSSSDKTNLIDALLELRNELSARNNIERDKVSALHNIADALYAIADRK